MRILITNDDGIDAPGLARLVSVARRFGDPVVVAPEVCHSAKSHAISMRGPIRVDRRPDIHGAPAYACSGTPADCVRVGVEQLPELTVECVMAGINPGANCGVDVFYSGTVAAAREAAVLGVPGIAISQLVRNPTPVDWDATVGRAEQGLQALLGDLANLPMLTNLNLPVPANGAAPEGVRWCPLSLTSWPMTFERQPGQPGDGFVTEYVGSYLDRAATSGDFPSLVEGWITLTPLRLDTTDHAALANRQT